MVQGGAVAEVAVRFVRFLKRVVYAWRNIWDEVVTWMWPYIPVILMLEIVFLLCMLYDILYVR